MLTRTFLPFLVVLVVALGLAPSALAVPCGTPPKPGKPPAVGTFALKTEASDDAAIPSFKEKTKSREFIYIFSVAGCTVSEDADLKLLVGGDARKAVIADPPAPKGDQVAVTGTIDPSKFDPGTHKATLALSSPSGEVTTTNLRLTLQRKQPPTIPTIVAIVALVLGFLYAVGVAWAAASSAYDKQEDEAAKAAGKAPAATAKKRRRRRAEEDKVEISTLATVLAVVVAGGLAYAVYRTGYLESDVWEPDFTSYATLFFGVAAAAAGGATGPLSKAIKARALPEA